MTEEAYRERAEQIANRAVILGENHDRTAATLWPKLAIYCASHGVPFTTAMDATSGDGRSFAERVLAAGDWASVEFIFNNLPVGSYAKGRVCRTQSGLYNIRDGLADGPGMTRLKSGRGMFAGHFVSGDCLKGGFIRASGWKNWRAIE